MPSIATLASQCGATQAVQPYLIFGTASDSTIALNSAYVYGSTGNCFCFLFSAPSSSTVTDFWINVASYTGTWANTDGVINVEIRLGLNGSNKAGSSIVSGGSFTITLDGTTTGWIKKTGLSISLTEGQLYSIVIADADTGGVLTSNYVTLVRGRSNSQVGAFITPNAPTSINGFSTGSSGSTSPAFAIKYAGVIHSGSVFNTSSTLTNNSVRRGLKFRVKDWASIVGYRTYVDNILGSGETLELYEDGVNPGGAYIWQYTIPTWTIGGGTAPFPNLGVLPVQNWTNLNPNKTYRLIFDPAGNATTPRKITATGSPDADLIDAALGIDNLGNCIFTYESGGSWVDEPDSSFHLIPAFSTGVPPTISC